MENEKMKSPNFRLFSINAASVDHWAGYVFTILLPLWMCSWGRFATFLCGAMAVSLALSSTHLLSAPPISDDLSYPFKAILDLAQGPLNLAIILLPRFYNTEGNVSLFVSGGVFALALEFGVAVLVDVVYESAALRSTNGHEAVVWLLAHKNTDIEARDSDLLALPCCDRCLG
jgi:hypothetical protein